MTEATQRRHGLEPFIREVADTPGANSGLDVRIRHDIGNINLRGPATDDRFGDAVKSCLGQPLPGEPNTCVSGDCRIFWLGPDEWLILTDSAATAPLVTSLESSLSGFHAAINDVSGGQIVLQISGYATRDVFAKGCTLDFHPGVFTTGLCAQSGLAKANVVFALPDSSDDFYVVARRSFADYLLRWLAHAGAEAAARFHDG